MITKIFKSMGAAATVSVLAIGAASATPLDLTYNGYENGARGFKVDSVPSSVTPVSGLVTYGAGAFSVTDNTGSLGDFIAWCVDIENSAGSGEFTPSDSPFSNTFALNSAVDRIQKFFDANYSVGLTSNSNASAAFQAGLWEVLYDDDYDLADTAGDFTGSFTNTTAQGLAEGYLLAASTFTGDKEWNLTFLESTGATQRQNLVTVSAVPLPASVMLMLAALGGMGVAARRRKAA